MSDKRTKTGGAALPDRDPEVAVLKPGVRLGAFELEQKLALGGMAEIWSAKETLPGGQSRRVALKVLQPFFAQDDGLVAMFQDEASLAVRLDHPNIVRTYGAHITSGWVYQSMELLDGVDIRRVLSELARSGAWMKVPLALRIGRDVALALEHAHKMKGESGTPLDVVHRDISPHNVMLTKSGQVKVIDFGIARAAERMTQTKTGIIKGKLSYMAPEQALSHPVTARTDIFALGVVLWELLTMRRLFRGNNDIESLSLVAECKVPKIEDLNPMLPESASALINAMLAKDPEDRPASMAHVAGRFEGVLDRGFADHAHTDQAMAAFVAELIEPQGAKRQTRVFEVSSPSKEEDQVAERGRVPDPAATPPGTGPVDVAQLPKAGRPAGHAPKRQEGVPQRTPSLPQAELPRDRSANLLHEPSLPVIGPSLAQDLALGLTAPGSLASVGRVDPGALSAYANLPDDSTELPVADTHIPSSPDATERLAPVGNVFDEPTESAAPSQPELHQLLVQVDETVLENPNPTPPPQRPKIQIPDAKTAPTSRPIPRKPRPR